MEARADASLRVLGPTSLRLEGAQVEIKSASARELLVLLALRRSAVAPTESLVDDLWGESLPADPVNALHSRVRKLRRALDAAGVDGTGLVQREGPGYRLRLEDPDVDAWRCEALVAAAQAAAGGARPAEVHSLAESALALWYGEAFADARGTEAGQSAAVRFEELRQSAEELRAEALLGLGRDQEAVGHLTRALGAHPYNERFAAQLMLALYRSGRQADALEVYGGVRTRLVEELGVDPGPELQSLEGRILRQDADLAHERSDTAAAQEGVEVLELLDRAAPGEVAHRKTDTFRADATYDATTKSDLAEARGRGRSEVAAVEKRLGELADADAAAVVDLMLSYRAIEAWDDVCRVVARMSAQVAATLMVREQHAFALNRLGRHEDAAALLNGIIDENGPSSESSSLLGRVRKDQWAAARSDPVAARPLLEAAIEAYLSGFEADWRDAYPGINALTLMELADPPDPRRVSLRPLVRYAVERRLAAPDPDYWDQATLLELAALERDAAAASGLVARVRAAAREPWEPATTARNLSLLSESFAGAGEDTAWLDDVIEGLRAEAEVRAVL